MKIRVAILMGSRSDLATMMEAGRLLEQFQVGYEMRVLSAHRTPEETRRYALEAEDRGVQVLIAGAGAAAHLAGFLAAHTTLPVIGVPLDSSPLQGLDALLATVQMPGGVPVATMAIGKAGARNAALFALQILACADPQIAQRLREYRQQMREKLLEESHAGGTS